MTDFFDELNKVQARPACPAINEFLLFVYSVLTSCLPVKFYHYFNFKTSYCKILTHYPVAIFVKILDGFKNLTGT